MLAEENLSIDEDGFSARMEEQARVRVPMACTGRTDGNPPEAKHFCSWQAPALPATGKCSGVRHPARVSHGRRSPMLEAGQEGIVVTESTLLRRRRRPGGRHRSLWTDLGRAQVKDAKKPRRRGTAYGGSGRGTLRPNDTATSYHRRQKAKCHQEESLGNPSSAQGAPRCAGSPCGSGRFVCRPYASAL